MPNLDDTNNHFDYTPDGGGIWYHILIPEGSYDIEDINRVIQQKIKQNGHAANVTISANTNTLKAVLILENNYHVDFRPDHSICSLLGFNHAEYTSDYQESENPVNILTVNSVLVNIDIISGSYLNGLRNPTIYSFFPAVSPGYKIFETPANLVYLQSTA